MTDMKNLRKRQMMVGRVKQLVDAGYTSGEIASALNLPESTVRAYVSDIQKALENQNN